MNFRKRSKGGKGEVFFNPKKILLVFGHNYYYCFGGFPKKMYNITFQNEGEFFRPWEWFKWTFWVLGGAQWAKSGGEAVLLQFSDFAKDPICTISTDCFGETPVTVSSDHILCTFVCLIFDVWTLSLPISVALLHKNHFCSCGTVMRISSKPRTQLCSHLYHFHIHVLWHWQEKSLTYNEVYVNYETKCSR